MQDLFFQVFLEMGCRALGLLGGLDPSLQSMPTSWSHSCICAVLCLPPGTRTKMFVLETCCPISSWLPSPVIDYSFSLPVITSNPWLLPKFPVCYYQHPLAGSTDIQLYMFGTYTLAPYLLGLYKRFSSKPLVQKLKCLPTKYYWLTFLCFWSVLFFSQNPVVFERKGFWLWYTTFSCISDIYTQNAI